MESQTTRKVGNYALQSRILVLFMQAFFNFLIPDHDANVFNPPVEHAPNVADWAVDAMFSGFRRWDGVYFMHISQYGYTYENTLAFFPAFPLTVRLVANTVLLPLQLFLNYQSVLLLGAYAVNLICFVQATKYLHALTIQVMHDDALAMKVVQLFCINPASIFFSAAYSEAMFAMCTFAGMLLLEKGSFMKSAVLFGFSGATRSNGLINLAFIFYKQLTVLLHGISSIFSQTESIKSKTAALCRIIISTVLRTILCSLIVVAPFLIYQFYSYWIFCNKNADPKDLPQHILTYGNKRGYKMAHTEPSPWCDNLVPISYSYVQNTHWNVGFLSYYEFKQIPNFLLASPVVVITVAALLSYLLRNVLFCLTLGLYSPSTYDHYKKTDELVVLPSTHGYHGRKIYVYLVHLVTMVTFGMLFMHVQVLTRFICSSAPVFYFFLAWITVPKDQLRPRFNTNDEHQTETTQNGATSFPVSDTSEEANQAVFGGFLEWEDNWSNKAINVYFDLYFFVGIAAFVNFLPFT